MASKKTAGVMKLVKLGLILFAPAILLILLSTRSCNHKFKKLDDYGAVPTFTVEGADGKIYTKDDFKGKIVLMVNIQENCLDTCNINLFSFEKILYQEIQSHKKSYKDVVILCFANDANGNPVADLSTTQDMLTDKIHRFDSQKWIVVKGNSKTVYSLEHNGTNLVEASEKENGANAYQALMLLMDKEGQLRMVLPGKEEGMFRRMKESLALLMKQYDLEADSKKR